MDTVFACALFLTDQFSAADRDLLRVISTYTNDMSRPEGSLLYKSLFGLAAFGCLVSAWRARSLNQPEARRGLVALLLSSGLWAASQFGVFFVHSTSIAKVGYTISLTVGFSTVWAWLYFCSAYTRRSLHRSALAVGSAALLFVIIALLKITNPWHELYFGIVERSTPFANFAIERYTLYWITTGISYVLVSLGFFMLVSLWRQTRGGVAPMVALFGLMVLPVAINIMGVFLPEIAGLYHEPLGVALFAIGVLFVYQDRLMAAPEVGGREEPTLLLRPNGTIYSYNAPAEEIFDGLNRSALGKPLADVLPSIARYRATPSALIEIKNQQDPRYYQIAESRIRLDHFHAELHLTVLADVTEQQRQIQEKDQFVESIAESVSDGIFQVTLDGYIRYANRAMARMFGYETPDALYATHHKDLFATGSQLGHVLNALRSDGAFTGKIVYQRADGSTFTGRVNATLVLDADGEPAYCNGVCADLTVQKEREQALRTAKEEAETAAQLKESMLANMSHEIRTPLTAVIGFAELLQNQTSGSQKRFADHIYESGRRLESTLDSMLNLSKLESGAWTLNRSPVSLVSFVEEALSLFTPQANTQGVALHANFPSHKDGDQGTEPVLLDAEACRRVLYNLIDNAIKFTPADGCVTVRTIQEADWVCFEVEDTGIGISRSAQDTIFDSFVQESQGTSRAYEGSGLGLSIVRQFVDMMDGSITLQSQKGKGSQFTVRIPLPPQH